MVNSPDLLLSALHRVLHRVLFRQNTQKDILPSWSGNKLNFSEDENYRVMESFTSSVSSLFPILFTWDKKTKIALKCIWLLLVFWLNWVIKSDSYEKGVNILGKYLSLFKLHYFSVQVKIPLTSAQLQKCRHGIKQLVHWSFDYSCNQTIIQLSIHQLQMCLRPKFPDMSGFFNPSFHFWLK